MNSIVRLWNVIAALADSLTRTKEIIDAGNTRAEQALGLDTPPLKLIDVEPKQRGKKDN